MHTFKYYTSKSPDKELLGMIIRNSYTYTMEPFNTRGHTVFTISTYWENYIILINYLVTRKKGA